jgi:hypothetical protein
MSGTMQIQAAKALLEKGLGNLIVDLSLDIEDPRILIRMRDGVRVYIQYNDYDQYGYSILFTDGKLDRSRFDNYDDRWPVSTRPHHFHPRMSSRAFESVMTGKPKNDMPILCDLIKKGTIFSDTFKF